MATNNGSERSLPPFDPAPTHRLVQPPDPAWALGEGIRNAEDTDKTGESELRKAWNTDEKRGCRIFDLDTMEKRYDLYRILMAYSTSTHWWLL